MKSLYSFFSSVNSSSNVKLSESLATNPTENLLKKFILRTAGLVALFLFFGGSVWGQTTFSWRNDQNPTSGQWNVSNYWWNGSGAALPGGGEILFIDGSVGTTMTNDLPTTSRHKITFGSTNTPAARTIGGSSTNTFFEFGSTWPRIQNDATNITHTINFPIAASTNAGFNLELAANAGALVFGGTLNTNGRTIQIYGNNSAIDATNRFVRLGGIVSGAGALNVSQFGAVRLNATHTYTGQTTIDNGELWIESAGSIASLSSIFVGNGGQLTNVAKFWLSNSSGGTTFSRSITINNGNAATRFLGGLNTSGTHTFSGAITNNSTTGGLYLSALNFGGTTTFSGIISGGGALLVDGAGTVILSGSNTYTGGTRILSGTLSASSAANFGNTSGAITIGIGSTTGILNITTSLTITALNVTDASSAGVINVAASQIFTLTNLNTASGTNNTTKIGKSGPGTLTLSGAGTYVGQIQVGDGTVIVSNNAGLGTNNSTTARGIDLGLNVGDVSQANNVSVLATTGITVPQSIYVSPNTTSATRSIGLSGASGTATFNNEIYLDGNLTVTGTGTVVLSGRITNTGGIVSSANIVNLQDNANNHSGTTTINSGSELRLNPSSNATFASQIVLNGGTLGTTGITATRTWTNSSTLNVTANSTLALLSATAHTLTFAASDAISWTAGATINITGWSGNYDGTAGTGGRIFIGNSASGLTATQLSHITFFNGTNYYQATLLSSGELVPTSTIAALYWGGSGSWLTSNSWSQTSGGTLNQTWATGRAAIFNVANSTITGGTTNVSSITANENVTFTAGGTINTNGSQAVVFVANGKTFDFGTQTIGTTAGTGFIKNGPGIFAPGAAGAYPGGFTLNTGTVLVGGTNSLGTGVLRINGGVLLANSSTSRTPNVSGTIIGGDFQFGDATNYSGNTGNLIFSNAISLGNSSTRTITIGSTSTFNLNGVISGTSSNLVINATAAGTLSLGAANTYTGYTRINSGTLNLGIANAIPVASTGGGVILAGGTLRTSGAFSQGVAGSTNMGTLTLLDNSSLVFNVLSHSLYFAASDLVSWTTGKTLTITGWSGNGGSSGTGGKIFIGSTSTGLTATQLAQITINGQAVTQLSTGEIVPKPILYRSKQTGLWSDITSWETSTDEITWINATVAPNNTYGSITIRNGHTITNTSNISIDQVLVETGGTLNNSNITLTLTDGLGDDLSVYGVFISSGSLNFNSGVSRVVQDGGVYKHAVGGASPGAIPTFTWNTGSTCEITGCTSTMYTSGLSQSFSNFTWNCTGQTAHLTFGLATWTISGTLKISSTGSGSLSVGNSSFAATMNAGSFLIEGGSFYVAGASASQIMTFNITNNATQTGGNFDIGRSNSNSGICNVGGNFTTSGGITRVQNNSGTGGIVSTLTITGDVSVEGGSIDLDPTNAGSNVGRLFVKGNLSLSSGALLYTRGETGPVTTGSAGVYFDGTGNQSLTHSGGTLSTSTGGIGRRFFYKTTSGPTINEEYRASSAQTTVNGSEGTSIPAGYAAWPTSGSVINNLTINNSAGVTLSTAKQVNGTLTLTSGKLTTNGKALTLVNSSTGSSSSYVFADAAGTVTMNAVSSAKTIPIGTATDYTPMTVSSNSSTNYSTYISSTLPCTVGNADAVVDLAWNINGSNAPSNVVFQWNSTNQGSSFNPANSCEVGQYGSACPYTATTIGAASGSGPYTLSVSSGLVSGNNKYSIGNLNSILPTGPTLTPVALTSSLSTTYGTASSSVSFTASGNNLTANITATAQIGYEVSESQGSGYGSSVSVVSGATLWVRLAATQAVGNYNNGTAVVLSSTAATDVNVSTSSSGNTVSKATPTISTSPIAAAITYGQTLASSTLSGGSASVAGSFSFTAPSTAPNAGTANQSVTFTPTDDVNYNTTTTDVSVTVNKSNQIITFGALADKTTADAPFALTGTANSGLAISYSSSNTAVATIAGSTVTIVGAGQTTITASQPGDDNFNAATSVDQTLTVTIPACVTNSNQTGGWNFATASPSTTVSNITIGDLSQGNNNGTTTLITSTSPSSVYTGASGGNNAGAAARTGALNTGASGSAYFEFTLTPASGYNFTLTGISFGSRSTGTGPQAYSLRSSLDSYATDIATGSLTNNSAWALSSNTGLNTAGQGNANPVTFRIYGYNGSGSVSTGSVNWRIDDLSLTLTVSNAPSSASVGSTQNLCGTLSSSSLGGNTPVIGTGTWSQTSGPGTTTFSALNSASSTATATLAGTYVYKWSISNGCTTVNEASVTVSYNSTPSSPTASAQSFCSAASPTVADLNATGTNILWYSGATGGSPLSSVISLGTGTYYASQTVSGCEGSRTSVDATVNTTPTISSTTPNSRCGDGTVTLGAAASAGAINWYADASGGSSLGTGTSFISPAINTTTTYYVDATANSCTSSSRTAVVATVNVLPPSPTAGNASRCGTGSITLYASNVSAGATTDWYAIATGGTPLAQTTGSYFISNLTQTTTYYLEARNITTGCVSLSRVPVTATVNAIPTVTASATATTVCAGDAVTLTGAGASTYAWDNGITNGVAFTPSATATYTVTGTDANGCANTANSTVTMYTLPAVTASASQSICPGSSVTLSGGGASTYSWNNGITNGVAFTPSATATYTVTGTDANGCVNTAYSTVTINALPTWGNLQWPASGAICAGGSFDIYGQVYENFVTNASYTLPGAGIVAQFGYSTSNSNPNTWTNWSNATYNIGWENNDEFKGTLSGLSAGTYYYAFRYALNNGTCYVYGAYSGSGGGFWDGSSNVNGQLIVRQVVPVVAVTSPIACNGGVANISVTGSGGIAPYTGTGTFTANAGASSYTVTDANGCSASASVTITQPSQLVAASTATTISCNGGSSTVTVTATGGTTPYIGIGTYPVSAGTHSYTVTDVNGCTSNTSINVTQPALVNAPTGAASQTFCSTLNATLASIQVTGTAIQWYATNTGGLTLPSTTTLVDGTTYYATQTIAGCESPSYLAVTITIPVASTYYADADADGFGNSSVSQLDCTQPTGYVLNSTDCDDAVDSTYPGAPELCNNVDDNCSGFVDEGCPSTIAGEEPFNSLSAPSAMYSYCSSFYSTLAGSFSSTLAQSTCITGEDRWYNFTALSTGVTVFIGSNANDIVIELQDANGNLIDVENTVVGIGTEVLTRTGLTVGATYRVGIRNYNSNAQAGGQFSGCIRHLRAGGSDSGTSATYPATIGMCNLFKATYCGTTGVQYRFTWTGLTGIAAGEVYTRTQTGNYLNITSVTPMLPAGCMYNVLVTTIYTIPNGAGTNEVFEMPAATPTTITISANPLTSLRTSNQCSAGPRYRGAVVASLPWVCGVTNWRWRFTEVNPLTLQTVGVPNEQNREAASNYISLASVTALQYGKTYAVQTSPIYTYTGTNYQWGPVTYMCIIASAGMVVDATQDAVQDSEKNAMQEMELSVYPNPSNGEGLTMTLSGVTSSNVQVKVYDALGRKIESKRYAVDGTLQTTLNFANELSNGLYIVEVSTEDITRSVRFMVEQ